ncbi:general odorant-binding protein 56d-like [Drosophila elegans]|uniref:general odorant-binding protein 56d-like n=1 Tax=Drosophila elegans TaxID=30023 RepID=UPI0007E61A99|nr:general odorant-binding protein 56d-like [Drosophila elegans]
MNMKAFMALYISVAFLQSSVQYSLSDADLDDFKKLGQYCHKEKLALSIKNDTTIDKCARHCVMERMGFVSNGKVNIDTLIKKGNIYAYNAEHQKAIETQCRSIEDARKCEVGFQLSECIQATGDRAMNKIPGLNRKFNKLILQSLLEKCRLKNFLRNVKHL